MLFRSDGAKVVTEAARILGLPVIWTTVDARIAPQIGEKDIMGNTVFPLNRHMNRSFW